MSGYRWSSSGATKEERISLATSINQGEQRTRERAKNESHEWNQRTHGVENEGEGEREREREEQRVPRKEGGQEWNEEKLVNERESDSLTCQSTQSGNRGATERGGIIEATIRLPLLPPLPQHTPSFVSNPSTRAPSSPLSLFSLPSSLNSLFHTPKGAFRWDVRLFLKVPF